MAGESTDVASAGAPTSPEDAQKLWNEVAAERDGGSPEEKANAENQFVEQTPADPEAKPAAEATPNPTAKAEEDPFAGLSPAVVERLKRLDALETQVNQIPTLQRTLSEAQGRVSAMQSQLDQARTAAVAKPKDPGPSAAQIAEAAKSGAKWKALQSDFPEWADATAEFVQASLSGLTPQQLTQAGLTPEEVKAQIEQHVSLALKQAEARFEHEKVADRYPGWQDTVKQSEFVTWFQAQDANTQALAQSVKARDAIAMLDLYQRAKAAPADTVQQDRQQKLAAAVSSKPTGQAKPAGKTPDQMTAAELWEFERKAAAQRAKQTGLTY